MGFRTVVMLNNDQANEWSKDSLLGEKIYNGMNYTFSLPSERDNPANLRYGRVVECTHADTQTLALVTDYTGFVPLAYSSWYAREDNVELKILKRAADALGYRLVKKSQPKE